MLTTEQHRRLVEVAEDFVEYYCDEERAAGETVWKALQDLCYVKQQMYKSPRL